MSNPRVPGKEVISKTWTGTLANSANPDQTPRKRRLIRVCTVCLNYRKFRIKRNSLKSSFRAISTVYTQRHSTHQCCQCFDFLWSLVQCPAWNVVHVNPVWHCDHFVGGEGAGYLFFFRWLASCMLSMVVC